MPCRYGIQIYVFKRLREGKVEEEGIILWIRSVKLMFEVLIISEPKYRSSSIRKRRKQKYYMFHAIYIYIRMNGVYTLNNSRQTIIYRQYILGSNNEKVHIFKEIDLSEKYLHCFSIWQFFVSFGNCLQTTFVQTIRTYFIYLSKTFLIVSIFSNLEVQCLFCLIVLFNSHLRLFTIISFSFQIKM